MSVLAWFDAADKVYDRAMHEAVVMPRRTYVALPDLRVIERPGWIQLVTPSFKHGGFNEVSLAVLGDDADAVIDRTIAEYRALGCKFRWTIGPDSTPADLGARLAARGLVHSLSHAMVRDVATPLPCDLVVERVDATNVAEFTRITAAGWDMDPGPLAAAHRLQIETPSHALYLARVAGEPAGTASGVTFERSIYLMGGVVVPHLRGGGVYRALVAARLADARAAGVPLATTHARATTSMPILAKLGFTTVCILDVYLG